MNRNTRTKTSVYPLSLPTDLGNEIKALAASSGLSEADVMRLSLKRGLPCIQAMFTVEFDKRPCDCEKKDNPAVAVAGRGRRLTFSEVSARVDAAYQVERGNRKEAA